MAKEKREGEDAFQWGREDAESWVDSRIRKCRGEENTLTFLEERQLISVVFI